jgi:hypothetical protein
MKKRQPPPKKPPKLQPVRRVVTKPRATSAKGGRRGN